MTDFFYFNHRKFYRNEELIKPVIGDTPECTVVPLFLPASLDQDLQWEMVKETAEKLVQQEKFLFWEFDFGLGRGSLDLCDTARYFSFTLAIEEFLKRLYPDFKEHSFGVGLYRGDALFSERFSWNEELENNCKESNLKEEIYCAKIFAEYMHRLASYLPDGILPFCFIDVSALTTSEAAQILSRNRFCYLHLAVKGGGAPLGDLHWNQEMAQPYSEEQEVGLVLPPDLFCTPLVLQKLEQLLKSGVRFRIIPEALLNEHWDGLDVIMAVEDGLSAQGRRMLQGFAAADGHITLL